MYPVSEAFLQAVQENTRSFYWTGRITVRDGAVYEFGNEDIVKGSGCISSQCCGSAEIEIGTVYAAEMGITLYSELTAIRWKMRRWSCFIICVWLAVSMRKFLWGFLR